MRFEVRAIGREGVVSLAFDATDPDDARRQAAHQGYDVVSIRRRLAFARRGERFPLQLFTQELIALREAGLGLVEAVHALHQRYQGEAVRKTLANVLGQLNEGKPFSAALEASPGAFPPLYVETVRASEKTGAITEALRRFVSYQEQVDLVRNKLVSASIYPLLLIAVGGLVTLFLLGYVVPRFSGIYSDVGRDLPFASRMLLEFGKVVNESAAQLLVAAAVCAVAVVLVLRRGDVRQHLLALVWRAPLIGERLRIYQLARFYRTLSMLLRGGVPFPTATGMVAGLLERGLRERLELAVREVREGKSISESLDRYALTTPISLRMLKVGERSGDMGGMMERVAAFHDDELARWVDWFTRLFEPLLMIVIGLVIGVVVLLMYMPIFELAGSLQ